MHLHSIPIPSAKKIYFLSDFHLGAPNQQVSLEREKKVVAFLKKISIDAEAVFFLGDVFDFWFEYKHCIPKGYIHIQAQWLQMHQEGIQLFYFSGNHDQWIKNYFSDTFGFKIFHEAQYFKLADQLFFIAHGDGLGPSDYKYKLLKKVFHNKIMRFLFHWLIHPDIAIAIANYYSRKSRIANGDADKKFYGDQKEWLVQYSRKKLEQYKDTNYFVFGHRHLPFQWKLSPQCTYINLGDWILYDSYASFDGVKMENFNFLEVSKPELKTI